MFFNPKSDKEMKSKSSIIHPRLFCPPPSPRPRHTSETQYSNGKQITWDEEGWHSCQTDGQGGERGGMSKKWKEDREDKM